MQLEQVTDEGEVMKEEKIKADDNGEGVVVEKIKVNKRVVLKEKENNKSRAYMKYKGMGGGKANGGCQSGRRGRKHNLCCR